MMVTIALFVFFLKTPLKVDHNGDLSKALFSQPYHQVSDRTPTQSPYEENGGQLSFPWLRQRESLFRSGWQRFARRNSLRALGQKNQSFFANGGGPVQSRVPGLSVGGATVGGVSKSRGKRPLSS